ncbi:MAG: arginyltransferase [Nevskiaceae bacterium]|nr:MAG: arginyltransferase [Nevskiaceae bacterium]TBR73401.1 MAG: arginyltransferase [Nevskiaceae bacterium]
MSRTPGVPTRLLVGSEHACGYLPNRQARSAFMDPGLPMTSALYGRLLDIGFRRSGGYVYRPLCRDCHACQSARIPVARFRPDRSQQRCLQRNADIEVVSARALCDEHFALYRRYLRARHPDGSMDPDDAPAFYEFLGAPWADTLYLEFRTRADGALLAVAVLDRLPHGLSAVYTFFDPAQPHRSLGTCAILREVEITRAMGLPFLYLGYWVPGSPKMDYKRRFRPLEVLGAEGWKGLEAGD